MLEIHLTSINPSFPRRRESNFVEISRAYENMDSRLRGNDGLIEVRCISSIEAVPGAFYACEPHQC